jgi:cardiolipin synthase
LVDVSAVNLPNLITLARILSVPVVVWAIASHEMLFAFALFVAAGISDAVDGFLAKRFDMKSELGAYLDPLADKVLIVSIYVALGITEAVPRWLVILVVSRDLMIVGAVILSWLVGRPIAMRPLIVSKINTVAQIVFAGLVLGSLGFDFHPGWVLPALMAVVAALTLLSVGAYVREWVRHMGANETLR